MINLYENGDDVIGWHSDNDKGFAEDEFGVKSDIITLALYEEYVEEEEVRKFSFRNPKKILQSPDGVYKLKK